MTATILPSLGLHWPWFCFMFIFIQSENLTFAFKGSFPSNIIQTFSSETLPCKWFTSVTFRTWNKLSNAPFIYMSTTKSLFLADDVCVTDHIGKKSSSSKLDILIYFLLHHGGLEHDPWESSQVYSLCS